MFWRKPKPQWSTQMATKLLCDLLPSNDDFLQRIFTLLRIHMKVDLCSLGLMSDGEGSWEPPQATRFTLLAYQFYWAIQVISERKYLPHQQMTAFITATMRTPILWPYIMVFDNIVANRGNLLDQFRISILKQLAGEKYIANNPAFCLLNHASDYEVRQLTGRSMIATAHVFDDNAYAQERLRVLEDDKLVFEKTTDLLR